MSNIQTGAERMPHDLSHLGFLAGQIGRLITISTTPVIADDAIARSYALMALALFAVAALDRQRHEHPLRFGLALAVLANVTLHGLIVAGILAAAHGIDALRRGTWTWRVTQGGAIAAAGFAV